MALRSRFHLTYRLFTVPVPIRSYPFTFAFAVATRSYGYGLPRCTTHTRTVSLFTFVVCVLVALDTLHAVLWVAALTHTHTARVLPLRLHFCRGCPHACVLSHIFTTAFINVLVTGCLRAAHTTFHTRIRSLVTLPAPIPQFLPHVTWFHTPFSQLHVAVVYCTHTHTMVGSSALVWFVAHGFGWLLFTVLPVGATRLIYLVRSTTRLVTSVTL